MNEDSWVERATQPTPPAGPLVCIGWVLFALLIVTSPALVIAAYRGLL